MCFAVAGAVAWGTVGVNENVIKASWDALADSIEYMVNAHCADALVCISNCDKITPGMLMAASDLLSREARPSEATIEQRSLDMYGLMRK